MAGEESPQAGQRTRQGEVSDRCTRRSVLDPSTMALLKRIPLFSGLDESSLAALSARVRRRKFHGGVALFHEGDPGQTLYLIAEGSVNIQTTTTDGQPVHLAQ